MKHTTNTTEEMITLGEKIAKKLNPGDIILLQGELGAGKTTMAKGIAKGLGISDEIVSPTFTIMNVYNLENSKQTTVNRLVHIDTYRLESEDNLIEIGVEDYLGEQDTVTIIEWPEKIKELLANKKTIEISIVKQQGDSREITITPDIL
ncbi:MAG: tRNA (adenosine(37)-N6)-threonylcarbamoyltransferase complex ATPase subunit type 1 TsaE [Candidatus Magasanikbacteria bacterium CG_4_10_14_0_8_um_filter_32_14]|uniref:tRNA threonylcarbamoyladenosine biosynthesis protein TsaE n=2 Tax=Candidatus Magasanikiibacteriota TaxID=1752731 RepID=A0A2M7RAQ0_9BACT|nr:MAG: tRNA (adenosine(37)-N6)-threonylcarbamoyltransferase complex ATPase subunit type 1 TsaE [Candidatus Magasanikbacteria bacterium CG1_02_32_51]PIY93641.1 MAG: tRNA (adenosine(37)-N6)-threonylcarbamoyltransferase complex ATPase subunit type 1 TsaE [Candidatus Magasanikbacteria bacterium CG_4_10_14_0_8_um_filter_32_14]